MDNVDMGGRLRTAAAAFGLSIRISGCGWRRLCVVSWTGGIGGVVQEWFDKVLVGAHIRSWRAGSVRNSVGPLVSRLIGYVGGLVNRIGARAAPDLVVSIAHKEACDEDASECTKHEGANT
jgi:hypothetical protein